MHLLNKIMDKIRTRENVRDRKDKNYMGSITYIAVSYTHLDVYKRQVHHIAHTRAR